MMDIEKILGNVANTDMRIARQRGGLFITNTKNGLLELTYKNGAYKLITQGLGSTVLATGTARFVKPVLMQQYVIEYA